ncbi:uncharacterized protein LOC141585778 [Silene latifolia]|uniref:uncharacterized protein LOC141585778 n=1 Tax=Silene latifolia TaxID=37657 RepID=UPI003D76CE33
MANHEGIPISSITQSTPRTELIKGDTVQASIKKNLVKIFLELLNEGDTYKIRKLNTSSNRLGYDMATFHPCKIWEFAIGAMSDKLYVDVIGKLDHVYPFKLNGDGTKRMTIVLENNENQQLCCTVFGEYVEQMTKIEETFKNKNKPTLVLLYIKRSVYNGEVSISTAWGASQILVNPDMIEVHQFNKSFPAAEVEQNLFGVPENAAHHPPILASANIKSLDEIQNLTQGGSYVTMAIFVELATSGVSWFYNSCTECRLKVQKKDDGLWYCDKDRQNNPSFSLKGIGTKSAIPRPLIERDFIVKIRVTKDFNIEQKSTSYGVICLCDDPRTISKWKNIHAASKEKLRELNEDEPVTEFQEVTPQKGVVVVAETSDKSSATKQQEIKMGKAPMGP